MLLHNAGVEEWMACEGIKAPVALIGDGRGALGGDDQVGVLAGGLLCGS